MLAAQPASAHDVVVLSTSEGAFPCEVCALERAVIRIKHPDTPLERGRWVLLRFDAGSADAFEVPARVTVVRLDGAVELRFEELRAPITTRLADYIERRERQGDARTTYSSHSVSDDLFVLLTTGGSRHLCQAHDIGRAGMHLDRPDAALRAGQTILLQFELGHFAIETAARVAAFHPDGTLTVHFTSLDCASRRILDDYVAAKLQDTGLYHPGASRVTLRAPVRQRLTAA